MTGVGPLGCLPSQLATRSINGECVDELQQASQIFNPLLIEMTKDLNTKLGYDVLIVANAYQMNMNFINNPQNFGDLCVFISSNFSHYYNQIFSFRFNK